MSAQGTTTHMQRRAPRSCTFRAIVRCLVLLVVVAPSADVAQAHFQVAANIRVVHVEHAKDGIRAYMRVPMPLLVADLLGPVRDDGSREPAPFTTNREENGQLVHYVDLDEVLANPGGLGEVAADKHVFVFNGKRVGADVESVRVWPALQQTRFVSLEEVKRSFLQKEIFPANAGPTYVGDAVVDIQLLYRGVDSVKGFMFATRLRGVVPNVDTLANVIIHHQGGEPRIYRILGPIAELVQIGDVPEEQRLERIPEIHEAKDSALQDAWRFMLEGVRHISTGLDHVLFVICLTIGASSLRVLIYRVSGFTIGHTITLVSGFFGYAPSGAWFIPAVELGIALSIIYAAITAMTNRGEVSSFLVTTCIGLLHGLGFSFVLHEILKVDSPNLWVSLISFNIGVEIGQLLVVVAIWPAFVIGLKRLEKTTFFARNAIALAALCVALYWTYQRTRVLHSLW